MEQQSRQSGFEYWGGIECTINRVQNEYFDQLSLTRHYSSAHDLERILSLGIRKIRYPVLWERHEPLKDMTIDWRWTVRQLDILRSGNVQPIVGLLHHGSGPRFTNLTDPLFATGLSRYAGKVAAKFPWIEYYNPVNEPLTTARFSGLYGYWYPHKRDDLTFLRILLNEVKGIVLSMREIRIVNSNAKLIQSEDLAKTYSPEKLKYQADFENERRWLTYDLLCGKVTPHHPLWDYLMWIGLDERELLFFEDNPCVPDVAGFNYYLTSERYLDDELDFYPGHLHGGNHQHRYVDTEAIRIDHDFPSGLGLLLEEAWDRFGLPMAVTEAFISCSEEEQVRWLNDVNNECLSVRAKGIDLRALTFWALLGEVGWDKLVTSHSGEYQCGAFDVRKETPEETQVAAYIKRVCASGSTNNQWVDGIGWWKSEDRFHIKTIFTR